MPQTSDLIGCPTATCSLSCVTYKFSTSDNNLLRPCPLRVSGFPFPLPHYYPFLSSPPTNNAPPLYPLDLFHHFPTQLCNISTPSSEISPISSEMGCCVSTVDSSKPHPDGLKNQHLHPRSAVHKSNATLELESRSPPAAEEETVKEVLSETPISKSRAERNTQMPTIQPQDDKFQSDDLQEVFSMPQVPFSLEPSKIQMPIARTLPEKFESKEEVSEVSQLSEMCSVTESFSTTTTATIGEKREDEVTSKRSSREATCQRSIRSPSSNAPRKRPYPVDSTSARERRSKSPARRAEPSPERRSQGNPKTFRGRESGQTTTRKPNVGSAGVRRDAGEKSGRRSRSPSTRLNQGRVNAGGRSQLKPSGGNGPQLPPPGKAVENENENNGSEKMEEGNDGVPRESLENPHVSMECFIFL